MLPTERKILAIRGPSTPFLNHHSLFHLVLSSFGFSSAPPPLFRFPRGAAAMLSPRQLTSRQRCRCARRWRRTTGNRGILFWRNKAIPNGSRYPISSLTIAYCSDRLPPDRRGSLQERTHDNAFDPRSLTLIADRNPQSGGASGPGDDRRNGLS